MNFVVYLLIIGLFGSCNSSQKEEVDANCVLPPTTDPSKVMLLIDKSDYELTFYYDEEPLKVYPVVFGGNALDDKLRQGDSCTPEGDFAIRDLYPHASWDFFIWVDYPNKESWKKHKAALAEGVIPQGSSIGGEIGIHGVPDDANYLIDEKINWTLGCIALRNSDLAEIYPRLSKASKLRIQK